MKRFFATVLYTLLVFFSIASNSESDGGFKIYGKVNDLNGNPMVGAVISIENSLLGTSTNLNGDFTLTILKSGTYTLIASYIGYKRQTITVTVSNNLHLNFTLEHEPIMGEAVIVSATRASSKMPIAQTTINAADLQRIKTGFDIPYLLELVPSVVAISEGGTGIGNTSFRIRGTDMTRINVTVNGIPLNDPESQGVWWVNMPDFVNSVDNIQIQRGVGTSTHGAGAFGATVNFQTKTLNPEPFASGEFMTGSFNTIKSSVKAGTGIINDRFSFETRYSKLSSDGYIDRGWSNHQSLFFTGAWHTAKSVLRFNLIHGDQHTGITWEGTPDYMIETNRRYNPAGLMGLDDNGKPIFYKNESDNYQQTHYQLLYSHRLNNNISLNLSSFWIKGIGYYEQYKLNRKLSSIGIDPIVIGDETFSRTDLIRQKWLDNNMLGATYSVSYTNNKLNTILGGGYNHFDNDHFGNIIWTKINAGIPNNYEWYRNNGKKQDVNTFAKATYQLNNSVSLFGDYQYRLIHYGLTGFDDDLQNLNQEHSWYFSNPKMGAFININPSADVYLSVGTANREPSRADIKDAMKYGNNQTPKPERLIDYEAGYTYKSQAFALGVNLYYMDYKDQLVLTGKLSDVGYPLMTNVEESYRMGTEVMAGFMPVSWARWDANITISENKIINFTEYVDLYDSEYNFAGQRETFLGNTDISFSPNIVASSHLRFTPIEKFGIALITKYVGNQYIDNTSNTDRMLNAYSVSNVKFDYSFSIKGTKDLNVSFLVNNIFNSKYIANAWVYREAYVNSDYEYVEIGYYPQAELNFLLRVAIDF